MEFRKWKVEGIDFRTGQSLVARVPTLVSVILAPSLVRCRALPVRRPCFGARRILRRLVLGKKRTCIAFWSVNNYKHCVGSLSGDESGVDEYRPGRFQDVRCGQGLTWNGFLPRQRAKSVQSDVAVNLRKVVGVPLEG